MTADNGMDFWWILLKPVLVAELIVVIEMFCSLSNSKSYIDWIFISFPSINVGFSVLIPIYTK